MYAQAYAGTRHCGSHLNVNTRVVPSTWLQPDGQIHVCEHCELQQKKLVSDLVESNLRNSPQTKGWLKHAKSKTQITSSRRILQLFSCCVLPGTSLIWRIENWEVLDFTRFGLQPEAKLLIWSDSKEDRSMIFFARVKVSSSAPTRIQWPCFQVFQHAPALDSSPLRGPRITSIQLGRLNTTNKYEPIRISSLPFLAHQKNFRKGWCKTLFPAGMLEQTQGGPVANETNVRIPRLGRAGILSRFKLSLKHVQAVLVCVFSLYPSATVWVKILLYLEIVRAGSWLPNPLESRTSSIFFEPKSIKSNQNWVSWLQVKQQTLYNNLY